MQVARACDADGWASFELAGAFHFRGPCELSGGPGIGTDSRVGRYELMGLTLSYDYGDYSSPLTEWSAYADYARQQSVVDGRDAEMVTARDGSGGGADNGEYLAGVYVPEVEPDGPKLTMYAQCGSETERQLALHIFGTLAFP